MNRYKNFGQKHGIFAGICLGLILLILVFGLSFLAFSLAYGITTIILFTFFNFVLPFSWTYAFGAGLIGLLFIIFVSPASGSNKRE